MQMRYDFSPVPPLTPVTRKLVVSCTSIYFITFALTRLGIQWNGFTITDFLGLVPQSIHSHYWLWQFATYIFLHGHPLHLLLNMLILWYFGSEMEMRLGSKRFLSYFFICGIGAGIFNFTANILFSNPATWSNPIIGASGAIYGILAAYGVFFANRYFLIFFLFPIQAKYFVLIMAGMELIMGIEAGSTDNVAHFAHLGGMVVGWVYTYGRYVLWPKVTHKSPQDRQRERLKRQFTLIVNGSDEKDSNGKFWN